ncbi:MAG: response regulator [Cryobacterium sp.]|nr:response regulator [Oligoflexia bacterium]
MNSVLLVEDDPVLGRGLTLSLEFEGYRVFLATHLSDAHTFFLRESCRLVLLDRNLPDGNGIEFLKSIRAAGSSVHVIILTAQTDEDSVVEGLSNGANDYMRKPLGNRELLARMKAVVRETNSGAASTRYGDLSAFDDLRKIFR